MKRLLDIPCDKMQANCKEYLYAFFKFNDKLFMFFQELTLYMEMYKIHLTEFILVFSLNQKSVCVY